MSKEIAVFFFLIFLIVSTSSESDVGMIGDIIRMTKGGYNKQAQNEDIIQMPFSDCSSFYQMDITDLIFSNDPNVFLQFNFTVKGKINTDVVFKKVKLQLFQSLVPLAPVELQFEKSYKKGQTFSFQSPYLDMSIGHIGLWTFFLGFMQNGNQGCMKFDFVTDKIPPKHQLKWNSLEVKKTQNSNFPFQVGHLTREKNSNDLIEWKFNDCSSFSQMNISKLYLSNKPSANLNFSFTVMGKANQNLNFTFVNLTMFISTIRLGTGQLLYKESYNKGDNFKYESPVFNPPQGHFGLWTFFVEFITNQKTGCMNFDVIPKRDEKTGLYIISQQ